MGWLTATHVQTNRRRDCKFVPAGDKKRAQSLASDIEDWGPGKVE